MTRMVEDASTYEDLKTTGNGDMTSLDDVILVHVGNRLPIDNLMLTPKNAGAKLEKKVIIDGETRKIIVSNPRDTIHFTVNGTVSSHAYGDFEGKKYAILLPLKSVKKENMLSGSLEDAYFKGNILLPNDTIILCPESECNELSKDNPNIHFIGYPKGCANDYSTKLVKNLGYRTTSIGSNYGKFNKLNDDDLYKTDEQINEKYITNYFHLIKENNIEFEIHYPTVTNVEYPTISAEIFLKYLKILIEEKKYLKIDFLGTYNKETLLFGNRLNLIDLLKEIYEKENIPFPIEKINAFISEKNNDDSKLQAILLMSIYEKESIQEEYENYLIELFNTNKISLENAMKIYNDKTGKESEKMIMIQRNIEKKNFINSLMLMKKNINGDLDIEDAHSLIFFPISKYIIQSDMESIDLLLSIIDEIIEKANKSDDCIWLEEIANILYRVESIVKNDLKKSQYVKKLISKLETKYYEIENLNVR